ncbi:MAG: hypothetical protein ABSD02_20875 [Steroidobacteraceae bacterium]
MIETRQNLALISEALHDVCGILAGPYQLDGDLFLVFFVGAGGAIHLAHSSRPDFLHELILADVFPYPRTGGRVVCAPLDGQLIGGSVGQTNQPSPSRVRISSFPLFCCVHPAESRSTVVRPRGLEPEVCV